MDASGFFAFAGFGWLTKWSHALRGSPSMRILLGGLPLRALRGGSFGVTGLTYLSVWASTLG